MTWKDRAAAIIAAGTKDFPAKMPLPDRIKAVGLLCPNDWRTVSLPQKAWQSARRDYLIPFGYQARTKAAVDRRNAVIAELPLFQT